MLILPVLTPVLANAFILSSLDIAKLIQGVSEISAFHQRRANFLPTLVNEST